MEVLAGSGASFGRFGIVGNLLSPLEQDALLQRSIGLGSAAGLILSGRHSRQHVAAVAGPPKVFDGHGSTRPGGQHRHRLRAHRRRDLNNNGLAKGSHLVQFTLFLLVCFFFIFAFSRLLLLHILRSGTNLRQVRLLPGA